MMMASTTVTTSLQSSPTTLTASCTPCTGTLRDKETTKREPCNCDD